MTSDKDFDQDFDLDDLKAAMTTATPAPEAETRTAHIALAERSFADYHAARPSDAAPKGLLAGLAKALRGFGTKGGLTATTALVAAGFLMITPQGQSLWQRGPMLPTGTDLSVDETTAGPSGGEQDVTAITPETVTRAQPTPEETAALLEEMNSREETPEEAALLEEGSEADTMATEVMDPPVIALSPDLAQEQASGEERPGAPLPVDNFTDDGEGDLRGDLMGGALGNLLVPEAEAERDITEDVPALTRDLNDATPEAVSEPLEAEVLLDGVIAAEPEADTETFANEAASPVRITVEEPVSTFSIDVDTASYAIIRQSLSTGVLPPAEAVRIEEMINYFDYDYAASDRDDSRPFEPNVTVMQTPWNEHTRLVHIGLQGVELDSMDRVPLNLVFLIDTSGSMDDPAKLPLLRTSLLLMLDELRPGDEVAIVTYAGSAGLALPATTATNRTAITAALNNLTAGGSTNGQGGLEQAYDVARSMMSEGEVSRVILATDGDFNVGLSDPAALTDFIAAQRDSGVYLSVLGFGRGNLDDATMQALAQNGNGFAAYIDTLNEAQRVLVDQLPGALFAIAGDVKVQVEWNPGVIAEYRLIGYETRALARQDFNNDQVDAGELGAGHSVTAIYEVTPVGSPALMHDPLRYQPQVLTTQSAELGYLRLRWKAPGEDVSQLYEVPITDSDSAAGTEAQFAAAIAGFGQLLRGSGNLGDWSWDEAIALANENTGPDPLGSRRAAVQLMRLAQTLSQE